MDILLIQPPSAEPLMDKAFLFEPLALEYLGAALQLDSHRPVILDARLETDVESVFRRIRPSLVGITGFTSHVNVIKGIAARLKALDPEVAIVVGGHHATVCPSDFNVPEIDLVVIGEGCSALREIARELEHTRDWGHIPGLGITGPGEMSFTTPRPIGALDDLPLPARHLTARYRNNYFSDWFKPLASIRTSLGCTARCTFCALWSLTGGKYLRRDPSRVVEELRSISEPNVFFCDDESMCDVKRMDLLADAIREAGIRKKYFLYARVDTIVEHPDLFAKWARIGLKQVFVGMEDFSDTRLKALKKGVTSRQQEEAVRILEKLGVMMWASFMVDPNYDREDFRALHAYVRKLKLRYPTFTVMTPLPGTELAAQRQEEIISRKPELYDMFHSLLPTRMPLPEFYAELARLYETAVPLLTNLRTIARFGPRGMMVRLKVIRSLLEKMRAAHLEY